jgi:hypothetical protein
MLSFKTVTSLACGVGLPPGLDHTLGSLALISTNTELKSDEIFSGLFDYDRMLKWYNYSLVLDPASEKIILLSTKIFSK